MKVNKLIGLDEKTLELLIYMRDKLGISFRFIIQRGIELTYKDYINRQIIEPKNNNIKNIL